MAKPGTLAFADPFLSLLFAEVTDLDKPRVDITYCAQCNFLLRSAWIAQELLTTFPSELGEVALIPSGGGIFEVRVNGKLVWSKRREGRFPESKELKQRIRDCVAPEKDLGHSDRR